MVDEEGKVEFDSAGEALCYISLDQARVLDATRYSLRSRVENASVIAASTISPIP